MGENTDGRWLFALHGARACPTASLGSVMATPKVTCETASESCDGASSQAPGLSAVKGPGSNECKDSCPQFLTYAISIKDADGVSTPPLHSLCSAHNSLKVA
jgi:hypothetical protein